MIILDMRLSPLAVRGIVKIEESIPHYFMNNVINHKVLKYSLINEDTLPCGEEGIVQAHCLTCKWIPLLR